MFHTRMVVPACLFTYGLLINSCKPAKPTLFRQVHAERSGIDFNNEVIINDTLNILTTEFVYNGGGVAVGDLNGDGLDDIFFTGNQVDNRMYLNKGEMRFQDATHAAGLSKAEAPWWSSGISIVDINADGKLDIYICNTFLASGVDRRNLLYINDGNTPDGIPTFSEQGVSYGLADTSHSSHAQFFDYDNDGDLDVFIGVNWIEEQYPNQFEPLKLDGSAANRDLLYRNDFDSLLGHPKFTDVSLAAGLFQDGYSHSTLIHDFNEDGWLDIYVANDYFSNDLIFINNQDGTFTNRAGDLFKHFSLSAMGSDVADINNDGRADFFTSEMQPYYNKRKKLFQGESNYQNTINTVVHDYEFQYTRNTLQLNLGTNPRTDLPLFAEIGLYAGVMETDWSWTGLFGDVDNDGHKDLFISNGFPKDVTDRDFSDFRAESSRIVSREVLYDAIPEVKSPNFIFRNQGDLTFENSTKPWGIDLPSFSYGAAYCDFDQDGDLDLVVNNMYDTAFLFENKLQVSPDRHFLRVRLQGLPGNSSAIGAKVEIRFDGQKQVFEIIAGRGYLSQSELVAHFGVGSKTLIDTVRVYWPDELETLLTSVPVDQEIVLSIKGATRNPIPDRNDRSGGLMRDAKTQLNLHHLDQDRDYIDFNIQRTLPHKFSQYGPAMAIGDVNGDKLDDVLIGAGRSRNQMLFVQTREGTFSKQVLSLKVDPDKKEEDTGILLFDADGDGDQDLYLARGSGQEPAGDESYRDALYLNDGKGDLSYVPMAIPKITANSSCVKAADYDGDGDLDLFVGSRVLPRSYPMPDRCFVLRNESTNEDILFVDVTDEVAPDLLYPGLISDALWTDFNGDHLPDLVLAGEWMPLTFFANDGGRLRNITSESGIDRYRGWWNSLTPGDFDNDGDIDYIAGNFGENLYYQCSSNQPLRIYGKDLDSNGSIDPLITCYWQDSLGVRKEFLYHPRQDLIKQFVGIRKKFNTYGAFGEASMPEMFSDEEMEGALILQANWMKSSLIENKGNGRFDMHALPVESQLAPIYGSCTADLNADGFLDILLVGNDHGMEVQQGRADALNGLVLVGNGKLDFRPLSLLESNFVVSGDARGLGRLNMNGKDFFLATQNKDSLQIFTLIDSTREAGNVPVPISARKAIVNLENGDQRLVEFYFGQGFNAQSSRYIDVSGPIEKIYLMNDSGAKIDSIIKSQSSN